MRIFQTKSGSAFGNLWKIEIVFLYIFCYTKCDNTETIFFKGENYMKKIQLSLNSIEKVKDFVNKVSRYEGSFDLLSGRYMVDAKSIMGIFSMDLSKPVTLQIHDDAVDTNDFKEFWA